jgi:catalase
MLRNVSDELAGAVADGLGISLPKPMPKVFEPSRPEVKESPALSLTARPGDGSIRGRKIAILIAPGVDGRSVSGAHTALTKGGAVPRLLAARLATVETADGDSLEPDATLETMPSVLFDAMVIPDGEHAASELRALGQALEFVKDQYRHCKPILMLGAGKSVVEKAGVPTDDESDWAMAGDVRRFVEAVGRHRNWDRATDPPRV